MRTLTTACQRSFYLSINPVEQSAVTKFAIRLVPFLL
jgi:hypothetical protein